MHTHQKLRDKILRYLIIIIVTNTIYQSFDSTLYIMTNMTVNFIKLKR